MKLLLFCLSLLLATAHAQDRHAHDMHARWQSLHASRGGLAVSLAADSSNALWRVEARGGHLWVSRSTDQGQYFSTPVQVNAEPETVLAEGQNRPQIAVLEPAGAAPVVVVAWSRAREKVLASEVRLARSDNGGASYAPPRTVNDDGRSDIGHSFVALAAQGTRLTLAWIDARAAQAARAAAGGQKDAYSGSAIYVAESADAGASFAANRKLADHSCECCQLALANPPAGAPLLLWRHIFEGTQRDFALADVASGAISRASHDNWAIQACPHHGGDIAVAPDGTRHWAWFTGAAQAPGLHYRQQRNGALSAPQPVGNPDAQAGYPVIWAGAAQDVHLAWREFIDGAYALRSRKSQDGGRTWSADRTIATSRHAADIPRFVRAAARPLLAWNTHDEGMRVIDLGSAP